MKLKQVEILGFKSFAEKTVIEFHEGITCVVGPNGCGKSNIGDAIRWVLGEQSAKAMRGGKMPDVIFAGASSKKPLNFAEVAITFTEIDGALPLDYEEITVKRRVHRSGESEYFINQQPVRLKDIHSLFWGSGIGKSNISFFEQGRIDQLIQYSPFERRSIFEEVAGIGRFLQRKAESLRKLDDMTLNLTRIADIRQEVDKQIAVLEEQAASAIIFKEKKQRLDFCEKSQLASRYLNFMKKKGELAGKEAESKEVQNALNEKRQAKEALLLEKKQSYDEVEAAYRRSRDRFLSCSNQKQLKLQSEIHAQERLQELSEKKKKIHLELEGIRSYLEKGQLDIQDLKARRDALSQNLKKAEEMASFLKQELLAEEKDLQELQKKEKSAYREKADVFQRQASLQSEVKSLLVRVEASLERKRQFECRSGSLSSLIQEKEADSKRKKEAHEKEEALTKKAIEQLVDLESRVKDTQDKVKQSQLDLEGIVQEAQGKSAKLKALLSLKAEFAGFSLGGKKLLQESQDPKSPIFGMLTGVYEHVTPKSGGENAINAALKNYAHTLVVKTKEDLSRVLDRAKKLALSDYSLICLEYLDGKQNLSAFLDNNSENMLGEHLLDGLEAEANIPQAIKKAILHKQSFWLSDIFVDAKGVLFMGGSKDASIFLREAEIKSLEKELLKLSSKKDSAKAALEEQQQQLASLLKEKSEADIILRKNEIKGVEANFAYRKALEEWERTIKEKAQVDDEIQGISSQIQGLLLQQTQAEETFKCASASLNQIQATLQDFEKQLLSSQNLVNEKKKKLQDAEIARAATESDYRKAAYQFNVLDTKNAENLRLQTRLNQELTISLSSEKEWAERLNEAQAGASDIFKDLEAAKEESEKLDHFQGELKMVIKVLEEEVKALEKGFKELENKLQQMGIQMAHVETGQNAAITQMKERFDLEMEEAVSQVSPIDFSAEKLEKEIHTLKSFIEANQNVNLAAISECKESQERSAFLGDQMNDLETAKTDLLKIIATLDQESRTLFKTTFEAIRSCFQKNFQILFKGGEADLELVEEGDILESGIEITAKPPGKQMRSLSLLSGGEKCLTAMALLFAIFEIKPSPFCILDEIDAPLDDSNVERFLNVVKQFIDRCQFIIVTHNKGTMALADRLYGVSMEEKGISKVLFMKFSGKTTQLVGV